MSIVVKTKNKSTAKKLMGELLEKYEEVIEGLYGPFDYIPMLEAPPKNLAQILLELDDYRRKTFEVVLKLGKATAKEVAYVTKRARALESSYLNRLVREGYLKKKKKRNYFSTFRRVSEVMKRINF